MKLQKIKALTNEYLESIGFVWHTDEDNSSYVAERLFKLVKMKQMPITKLQMSFMICL